MQYSYGPLGSQQRVEVDASQYLVQQRQSKQILFWLFVVFVILTIDLLFVQEAYSNVFSHNLVMIIYTLVVCSFVVIGINCLQNWYQAQMSNKDKGGISYVNHMRNYKRAQELLRVAGIENQKKPALQQQTRNIWDLRDQTPQAPVLQFNQGQVEQNYLNQMNLGQQYKSNQNQVDYSNEYFMSYIEQAQIDNSIDRWISNSKQWLAIELIPMVIDSHIRNVKNLNQALHYFSQTSPNPFIYEGTFIREDLHQVNNLQKHKFRRLNLKEITQLVQQLSINYTNDLNELQKMKSGQNPQYNEQIERRVQLVESLLERKILDKYFKVANFKSQEHIIDRLTDLASTSCLSTFRYNNYGSIPRNNFKYLTDSDILSHIFFTMLQVGNDQPSQDMPFLIKQPESPPQGKFTDFWFYQKNGETVLESHFDTISGQEYQYCIPGRNNVFCAISYFLLHCKEKCNGFFGKMDCKEIIKYIIN